ncbi:MAG: S8 family serine peptidase [Elusimicrobia bacterium]|nr:S8 family serine peptidase [Elusimicrobiota bacterium]
MQGQILVKYKKFASPRAIQSLHSSQGAAVIKQVFQDVQRLKLKDGVSVEEAVKMFAADPNVEHAQPNYIYEILEMPNDTHFDKLWGLHNNGQTVNNTAGTADADIDAPEAWTITKGEKSSVVVAVIDTGIMANHADLLSNVLTTGYDYFDEDNDPADDHSHGTHVSGTIAAYLNNSTGIVGVNPNAKIMALRGLGVTGSSRVYGLTDTIAPCFDYARTNGAKVINASLGGHSYDQLLYEAVKRASDTGVLSVVAAGNDGYDNATVHTYPSDFELPNLISVAATDQNDALAGFSNYSASLVHVAAPGVNIYSSTPSFSYSATVLHSKNFDSDTLNQMASGWTSGGTNNAWAVTNSTYMSSSYSLADSTGGNYANNTDSYVWYGTSIPYFKDQRYILNMNIRYDLESNFDYLYIVYSTDAVQWSNFSGVTGSSLNRFVPVSVNLTGIADEVKSFYIGFRLKSDASTTGDGVYIDDIVLNRETIARGTDYGFKSGTSMATPHVAGLASLIWSYNPSLKAGEVKDIILRGVDKKGGLSGRVGTGGRINAYSSMKLAQTYAAVSKGDVQVRAGDQGYVDPESGKSATIYFKSPNSGTVEFKLYTLTGDLVWKTSKPASGDTLDSVVWNGKNEIGDGVSSGIYLLHIDGAGIDEKKKIAVIK